MPHRPLTCLVVESEPPDDREARRDSVGRSSGESYVETLRRILPDARCTLVRPVDPGAALPEGAALEGFDAVFVSGSPLSLHQETPATRRVVEFGRAIFASGTPAFGSCAGLQIATVAAGGSVRPNAGGQEAGFARRISPTAAGLSHPLLAGRPASYDAPSIHTDEVERLPEGAVLLASNAATAVQAAEIRLGPGLFWGVQYHPELTLREVAGALRRQAGDIVDGGLARERRDVEDHADLIEELGRDPGRRDIAWRLGLDGEVTVDANRMRDLTNFVAAAVRPERSRRGRD